MKKSTSILIAAAVVVSMLAMLPGVAAAQEPSCTNYKYGGPIAGVEWDAVPGAESYEVWWRSERNLVWELARATPDTKYEGLLPDQVTFDFRVRAIVGVSATEFVPCVPFASPAPASCTFTITGDTRDLSWPAVDGASRYGIYSMFNGLQSFERYTERPNASFFSPNDNVTYSVQAFRPSPFVSDRVPGQIADPVASDLVECVKAPLVPPTTTTTTPTTTTSTTTTATAPAPKGPEAKCTNTAPSTFAGYRLTPIPSDRNTLYRAYCVTLFRYPDMDGFEYWLGVREAGVSWQFIEATMADSAEFRQRYGTLDDTQFMERLYNDVLGRGSDKDGLAYWTDLLVTKKLDRGEILFQFSDSDEFRIATRTA